MNFKKYLNFKNYFVQNTNSFIKFNSKEFHNLKKNKNKKLIVGTASGRSGLRWLSSIHASHNKCKALIEPYPLYESFYRYATYNKLNIDHSSFLNSLNYKFLQLWEKYDTIIYASPWICFDLDQIDKVLSPDKYIFIFRDPKKAVSSLVKKGWYNDNTYKTDINKITGLQPNLKNFHHNFSRISPNNKTFNDWNNLTTIGKCSWFWAEANKSIYNFIETVDYNKKLIFKLEEIDQNYKWYQKYFNHFELEERLSINNFLKLKNNMPNKGKNNQNSNLWTKNENKEFIENVEYIHSHIKKTRSNFV